MGTHPSRVVLASLGAVALLVGLTGAAWAVSGGGYAPGQQDCPPTADANNTPKGATSPGCHNLAVNVEDGKGKRYAEVGLDQLPNGYPATPGLVGLGYPGAPNSIHSGCVAANTNGTGGGTGKGCGSGKGTGLALIFNTEDLKANKITPELGAPDLPRLFSALMTGTQIYVGMDDNADAGEHDGVSGRHGTAGSINGPSDGGGVGAHVTPGAAGTAPTAANPVPVAGGYGGFCADGVCIDVATQQHALYHGCDANPKVPCRKGTPASRDAANYAGKQWDPYNCSSGDQTSEAPGPNGCGNRTMDKWRAAEDQTVYAEPGVQFYEDPDPQGSPAGPYPLPAAYVGTCGVVLGGGVAPAAPTSPITNSAGQIVVDPTGC